jgi:regulator of cell morphogenesis and NO signaling
MNIIQLNETAENIAVKDPRFAKVLKDFSDGSSEASQETGREVGVIETLQEGILINLTTPQESDTCDINSLIDYIINTHHSFVKANAVIIYDLAQQVAYRNMENHPEFARLASENFLFFHDLLNTIMIEEKILFPNIKQLIKNRRLPGKAVYTTFGLITGYVKLIEKQHATAAENLTFLRKLTNSYRSYEDSYNSCDHLYKKMQEFEKDWFVHVHLETNTLFPKAIALDEAFE